MPTAMVISPHADDAAAFCGATLAKFAGQGWDVVLVRVTDDRKDSIGLTVDETIRQNTEELHEAVRILGIREIVELGFETDMLADIPLGRLRERIVYLFRKYKPYAVFTFDPEGLYENNQDHVRVAQAVDEAFWVSCFDKHYPEHFAEGLEPFSVCERWYFARQLPQVTHYEDVSTTMEKKILALCAHRQMMYNTINQYRLQLKTWGKHVPWLDDSMQGDMRPLLGMVIQEQGKAAAIEAGWDGEVNLAEAFRIVRFGDMEPLFQLMAIPLEGVAEPAPERPTLDQRQESPWSEEQLKQIIPSDINRRIRLMGHHHLCAAAFDELLQLPPFRLGYAALVEHLKPEPDVLVETIYGYDIFCYQCGYWSEEDGRCSTGWKNKIVKDAAVLKQLGLKPGTVTRLGDLQRLLAEKVSYEQLERFCGPGEGKCEFYGLGVCQRSYARLRENYGIESRKVTL
ncbi:MAG: PIG-L family deacetylase [Anaerolineales bacterium]|nr:PIG-L family deacetylase [Anaerolineales bacterium]